MCDPRANIFKLTKWILRRRIERTYKKSSKFRRISDRVGGRCVSSRNEQIYTYYKMVRCYE